MVDNPQHIYTDTDILMLLIAYNNGCPDTIRKDSFVRVNPIAILVKYLVLIPLKLIF